MHHSVFLLVFLEDGVDGVESIELVIACQALFYGSKPLHLVSRTAIKKNIDNQL